MTQAPTPTHVHVQITQSSACCSDLLSPQVMNVCRVESICVLLSNVLRVRTVYIPFSVCSTRPWKIPEFPHSHWLTFLKHILTHNKTAKAGFKSSFLPSVQFKIRLADTSKFLILALFGMYILYRHTDTGFVHCLYPIQVSMLGPRAE